AALDALLMRRGDSGSTALIALHPPVVNGVAGEIDARAVAEAVRGAGPAKARALDIKAEADRLYAEYLREAGVLALAGALATVAVLAAALRSPHRLGRVCAPLAGAVVLTLGALAMVGRPLGILHLIGLLLIVAVGSNYALFFDGLATRGGNAENGLGTRLSLLTANLTTVSGFGVLAWSDTPALHAIGVTVGPGALFAFVLSAAWIAPTRKSWGQA
ncbi:MAG TPA: hypothetical protein VFS42_12520, partial [Burkholderiaceae bacterium]|nr:hypothetical protein [Burkholderiaceae bacterium]